MKSRPLLTQVLAVNLLLVAGTAVVATVGVNAHGSSVTRGREAMVLGLAVVATLLGNWLLLRRRFEPLDQLISTMEQIDLAEPEQRRGRRAARSTAPRSSASTAPSGRWSRGWRPSGVRPGWAAIEAQERERRRIAQDLHDEVNQALTAVTLRLQASIERAPPPAAARAGRDQATVQPGDGGAAVARPPAAPGGARRPRPDPRAPQPGPGLRRADRDPRQIQLAGDAAEADARSSSS